MPSQPQRSPIERRRAVRARAEEIVATRQRRRRRALLASAAVLMSIGGLAGIAYAVRPEDTGTTVVASPGDATTDAETSTSTSVAVPETTIAVPGTEAPGTTAPTRPPLSIPPPTTDAPSTSVAPRVNLSRNGPFRPLLFAGMSTPTPPRWVSDTRYAFDIRAVDNDGWVSRVEIDWLDGSAPDVHEFPLDGCGVDEWVPGSPGSDDPYPTSSQLILVEHDYPAGWRNAHPWLEHRITVTSVSCAGTEPQTETNVYGGGTTPPPTTPPPTTTP